MTSGSQIESRMGNGPTCRVAEAGACADLVGAAVASPEDIIRGDITGVAQPVTVIRAVTPPEASGPTVMTASPGSLRSVIVRSK